MTTNQSRDLDASRSPEELLDDSGDVHYVPAPCQTGCPIGTDAPSYIGLIWEGRMEEAFEAITATNPFSSSCARICAAPCETVCRRAESDGPIAIRNLKRYVMERHGKDFQLPPVKASRDESIGIVGGGPAALTAAQDLSLDGFKVHIYEMTERLGGMVAWGIPFNRLPQDVLAEDIDRVLARCPDIEVHFNTSLGDDVNLDELKERHQAVLLTIGTTWGKKLPVPGSDLPVVLDGVDFLHRVNAGERPQVSGKVVVIGGGDVAMDVARTALRSGADEVHLSVLENRDSMRASEHELFGALAEDVGLHNDRLPTGVEADGKNVTLKCVRTEGGGLDENGVLQFEIVKDSDYDVPCSFVMTAIGQQVECDDLDQRGMIERGIIKTDFDTMRTEDRQVFAAGDGAFGGTTIVEAMRQGHQAAYYIKAFLEGNENPIPYRTPHRTRRVTVAQDIQWSEIPPKKQKFIGLGDDPASFPESEIGYDDETAKAEAARCFRCDAETGSADYSVRNREDIISMAKTNPLDHASHAAMLRKRLATSDNPFPVDRPATLDDIVFLPANLTRLVIDPYREACRIDTELGAGRIKMPHPFIVSGFDDAPAEVQATVAAGLKEGNTSYLGARAIAADVPWWQLLTPGETTPSAASADAAALIYSLGEKFQTVDAKRLSDDQVVGLAISSSAALEEVIPYALDGDFDMLLLDGTGALGSAQAELTGAPDLTILRDAVKIMRWLRREEEIDLVYYGGVRSGTDAAKIIALGGVAVVMGVPVALAAGGKFADGNMQFNSDHNSEDRLRGVVNIIKASSIEASMMARCTGKTNLHNIEPEDLRAITIATAEATGVPLTGTA
ncbi:MAG: FAD-dependent oxidoreductase [Rhodospirillaceae bacterium]|nr:FAD-dependent oxidoreductase [Rhodospirillaceae bacterium]